MKLIAPRLAVRVVERTHTTLLVSDVLKLGQALDLSQVRCEIFYIQNNLKSESSSKIHRCLLMTSLWSSLLLQI